MGAVVCEKFTAKGTVSASRVRGRYWLLWVSKISWGRYVPGGQAGELNHPNPRERGEHGFCLVLGWMESPGPGYIYISWLTRLSVAEVPVINSCIVSTQVLRVNFALKIGRPFVEVDQDFWGAISNLMTGWCPPFCDG